MPMVVVFLVASLLSPVHLHDCYVRHDARALRPVWGPWWTMDGDVSLSVWTQHEQ
jgi:hypothetical protein